MMPDSDGFLWLCVIFVIVAIAAFGVTMMLSGDDDAR